MLGTLANVEIKEEKKKKGLSTKHLETYWQCQYVVCLPSSSFGYLSHLPFLFFNPCIAACWDQEGAILQAQKLLPGILKMPVPDLCNLGLCRDCC